LSLKTKVDGLSVVWPKNTGTVCQWFDLKIIGTVSPGLTSKPVATISPGLTSKPVVEGFLILALKSANSVW
jgi:hypothetical protein